MISSLQNYSIHGIVNGCSNNGDTIMLLIYSGVLEKTKFIIVDLKLNRYVCALGDSYNGLIDTRKVYAAWSTDRIHVLIRVPIHGGTPVLDFYKSMRMKYFDFNRSRLLFSCEKRSEIISSNYFH